LPAPPLVANRWRWSDRAVYRQGGGILLDREESAMTGMRRRLPRASVWGVLFVVAALAGCATIHPAQPLDVPHELAKVSLPPYVIESPDILTINALRLIPKPPYRIEPQDTLGIRVEGTLPEQPIQGIFPVEPDGRVNLGFGYGSAFVQGMTIEQAKAAIVRHLLQSLKRGKYQVTVILAESRAMQLIRGIHLVQVDGTVNLGLYGSVYVDNLTVPEAKAAIEKHLAQFLVNPEISLTVSGYNSKVFYIITDGGGVAAESVTRLPMTGKTTILDALGQIGGLPVYSREKDMWLVRPAPAGSCEELVLPIDYKGIVRRGETATNYQILPGDRLYVKAAPLLTLDAYVARVLSPIDRILGTTLLVNGVITSLQNISTFHSATNINGANGNVVITPGR
jgi:polysaccharide export outer membrane protein